MALDAAILQRLTQGTAADAWRFIIERTLDIASRPLAEGNAPGEVVKRDREIGELDLFLGSSGWDLWGNADLFARTCQPIAKRKRYSKIATHTAQR